MHGFLQQVHALPVTLAALFVARCTSSVHSALNMALL